MISVVVGGAVHCCNAGSRAKLIFVLILMILVWVQSAAKITMVGDTVVSTRLDSNDLDGLCRVFVDCSGLNIPDSLAEYGRRYLEAQRPRALRHVNADVFAYVYFDNDLMVERVSIGTFLPEGEASRDSMMTVFLNKFGEFLKPAITGKNVRPEALSFPGGRAGRVTCDDGFNNSGSYMPSGELLTDPLNGCLLLRIKFARRISGLTFDWRIAVVSLKQKL
jgi:hypothetical protein